MNRTQGRNCSVLPCSVIEISSGLPLLIVGGRFVFLLYFILSLISGKVQIIVSKMYKNKGVKGTRDQNLIAEWEGIGTMSFFWLWVESSPRELQDTDLVLARECISWDIPASLISYVSAIIIRLGGLVCYGMMSTDVICCMMEKQALWKPNKHAGYSNPRSPWRFANHANINKFHRILSKCNLLPFKESWIVASCSFSLWNL